MNRANQYNSALEYLLSRIGDVTQVGMSTKTGISQPEISMMKTGERQGTEDQWEKILNFFEIKKEDFIKLGEAVKRNHDPIGMTKITFRHAKIILKEWFKSNPNVSIDKETNDIDDHKRKKNKPHHDLVDEFEQPELAFEINFILREIEKRRDYKLEKIKGILLGELKDVKRETGEDDPNQKKISNNK